METNRQPGLRDGWTHDPDYRRCYQTEDEVATILRLLALTPASRLVDVGCGNGAFAIAAARQYPGSRVWAFDALESAVAECRAQAADLNNLLAKQAWAHALPLGDGSADRALLRSVLHHVAEPAAVYGELARVLEPGGRLVLQAPCNNWEGNVGEVLSDLMLLTEDSHRRFYHRPAQIVEGLQQAGFATGQPECWPYEFPFLADKEADFIQQHKAQESLRLHPLQPGKWSITGCWVRVVACRNCPEGCS